MNNWLYQAVASILQSARANNITVPCNRKYNVPPGNITVGPPPPPPLGPPPIPGLTSYTMVAIPGADDFNDNKTTIKDVFDAIVSTTREVTPTCMFPVIDLYPFVLLTIPPNQVGIVWSLGCVREMRLFRDDTLTLVFSAMHRMGGPSVLLSSFPHTNPRSSRTHCFSLRTAYVHPTLEL